MGQPFRLEHLRQTLPDDLIVREFPDALRMSARRCADADQGWEALTLNNLLLSTRERPSLGETNVAFYHVVSGLILVSPCSAGHMQWLTYYLGDGVFHSSCFCEVCDLIAIRYEIRPPRTAWARALLQRETPWLMRHGQGDSPFCEA